MIDKKPLFIQIKEYYEHLIDIGAFVEGDEMPSVRVVALEHNANPNTVQRAFSLMVESGYLISIPKKGFYVHIKSKDNRKEHLQEIVKTLLDEGYTKEEILKEVEELDK